MRLRRWTKRATSLPDCPALLDELLGFGAPALRDDSINVLVQLAASMRAHGRGGSLWLSRTAPIMARSIVWPVTYSVSPPFSELADLVREGEEARSKRLWQEAFRMQSKLIAGLTAVDGATVITDQYELLAFGAKIVRRKERTQVEQVVVTEPTVGDLALVLPPVQLGGTRHLSATQFVHDQRDAVALVASQDGRFTVFAWSPCEEMVHAHRVETLLL